MKYGENAKLLTLDPSQRSMPSAGEYGGDVAHVMDRYVIEAGDANGLVVKVGRILKGQRIIDQIVETPDGLGANVTLKSGDQLKDGAAGDDDRFIAATAFANAATKLTLTLNRQHRATEDRDLIVTIGGADPTVGRTIRVTTLLSKF